MKEVYQSKTFTKETKLGKIVLIISKDDEKIQVQLMGGRSGTVKNEILQTISTLLNLCFKYKCPLEELINSLKNIGINEGKNYSIANAIAEELENFK